MEINWPCHSLGCLLVLNFTCSTVNVQGRKFLYGIAFTIEKDQSHGYTLLSDVRDVAGWKARRVTHPAH